jgi:CheY-like chemotaxis protein/signal transduction histidine kinase
MTRTTSIDSSTFQRFLVRNIAMPVIGGLVGLVLFIGMVFYLLNAIGWVQHSNQAISKAHEISALTADMESGMRGFLIDGNESFLDPYALAAPQVLPQIRALEQFVADNPEQVERMKRVAVMEQEWTHFAQDVIAMRRAGDTRYREQAASGRGKRFMDDVRSEIGKFVATEQRLLNERNDRSSSRATLTLVIYATFSLLLTIGLAIFGRSELMRLAATYNGLMDEQAEGKRALEHLAWLREGQAQLATWLIGQQTLPTVGRNTLEFAGKYLGSVVGAVYARSDHGGLQRVASYGFSKELESEYSVIQGAETLVGQAAREKRVLRLDTLPGDYIRVSSGLGEAPPQSALVVPVEREGEINGVVELGFLRPLKPGDLELMQLLAADIGSSIEAARYRQRLHEVLAETQQLNEELQVQQEELRTANEELEEQSRVLHESQASLEVQQVELENSNHRLAEQAHTLDLRNTALKDAQHQLETRADELQRASRYKSEFLANMSHELRTPLNSSLILARLLADNEAGNLSAEQIKFAESIYGAGNDLLNLINDILDISKVEAGKLEIRPQDVRLSRLIDGLRDMFEPLAAQKKLQLQTRIASDAPQVIHTDRQRLEQIVKNLLSNAVKFTHSGSVALELEAGADGETIVLHVRDSGIGIADDKHEGIFEAFQQADGTTSRRYGGTGLGLTISRDLARMLGGTLTVQSAPGEGSTFTLTLPVNYREPVASVASAKSLALADPSPQRYGDARIGSAAASPRKSSPVPAATFTDDRDETSQGARVVLVVEDEPKFAHILFDLAHELGYRCIVAHGAQDGYILATRHAPHAILLDMGLPDSPGLSLLQRLKENPQTRHIPVHVISAEDRSEAAMHLGAIGYATKPTTRQQLKEIFGKLESKWMQKVKRVLVVEDDALQRESIAHLISDDDVEITAVELGARALELLSTTVYDCMIIDLKLPDMTGNELLRRMSGDEICSFPPVIIYTGRNLTHAEEAELLRYSHSIIIKGARSPERLLDEVTLFLHKVESQLSVERQTMLRTARNRDKVFEGRKILLVDDDVRNIFALTSALEHKGAIIEVGRNGHEALERLAQVSDIDLVLMDIMMPEMDGLEATREIRKNPAWKKLPVIAVTAKAMKDDQEQCLQAGANDYLAKPVDLDRLFSLMRVWMPKMERTGG